MTLVLITQECRPEGNEILAAVARRLRLQIVPRTRLVRTIAERMAIDEDLLRLLVAGRASWLERRRIDALQLQHCATNVLREVAGRDDTLVEDCGLASLACSIPGLICIYAGSPDRFGACFPYRMTPAANPGCEERGSGRRLAGMCWKTHRSPCGSALFDLVINTDRLSVSECVEQIVHLAGNRKMPAVSTTPNGCCRPSFVVSPSLEGDEEQVLEVQVDRETMKLAGGLSSEEAIARIERHLLRRRSAMGQISYLRPPFGAAG